MVKSRCSSCGGNLVFSPKNQCLMCEKCSSISPIHSNINILKHNYDDYLKGESNETSSLPKKDITNCSTCGASINMKGLEYSGKCPYCDTSLVLNSSKDNINIDAIIPFKIDKDNLYEIYRQNVSKKWFIPNTFKKKPPMDKVKGYYIPSFSFDANSYSEYRGVLENTHTDKEGNRHTERKHISGKTNFNLTNILIESSSKIEQEQLKGVLPYNLKEAVSYQDEFVLGYSVEKFEDRIENCYNLAKYEMDSIIRAQILSRYHYDRVVSFECNTVYSDRKYSYYMLPIYQIEFEYKDKKYLSYMNGQTGRVGTGIPKSPVKITFTVLLVLLFLAIIFTPIILSNIL